MLPRDCALLLLLVALWAGAGSPSPASTASTASTASVSSTLCPKHCECKWKRGKETVACNRAGFTDVPLIKQEGTQVLELNGNTLPTLTADLFVARNLPDLQEILLSSCGVSSLHPRSFFGLSNLVRLDLSMNSLASVPSAALEPLVHLRELALNANPIEKVHADAFRGLAQLVRLELSACKIRMLEVDSLSGLDSLEWLRLDGNQLMTLSATVLKPLRHAHGVALHDNPWNCTCHLRAARQWLVSSNVPTTVAPTCSWPEVLRGREWTGLGLDDFACPPAIVRVEAAGPVMSCQAVGDPVPSVTWRWQGHVVRNGSLASLGGPPSAAASAVLFWLSEHVSGPGPGSGGHVRTSNMTLTSAVAQPLELDQLGTELTCVAANAGGEVRARMPVSVAKPVLTTTIQQTPESAGYMMALAGVAGTIVVVISLLAACCAYSVKNRHGAVYVQQQHQQQQLQERNQTLFHFEAFSRRKRPNAKTKLSWLLRNGGEDESMDSGLRPVQDATDEHVGLMSSTSSEAVNRASGVTKSQTSTTVVSLERETKTLTTTAHSAAVDSEPQPRQPRFASAAGLEVRPMPLAAAASASVSAPSSASASASASVEMRRKRLSLALRPTSMHEHSINAKASSHHARLVRSPSDPLICHFPSEDLVPRTNNRSNRRVRFRTRSSSPESTSSRHRHHHDHAEGEADDRGSGRRHRHHQHGRRHHHQPQHHHHRGHHGGQHQARRDDPRLVLLRPLNEVDGMEGIEEEPHRRSSSRASAHPKSIAAAKGESASESASASAGAGSDFRDGRAMSSLNYDYYALQLDRFLDEYRALKGQLVEMRQACASLRRDNLSRELAALRLSIERLEQRAEHGTDAEAAEAVEAVRRRYDHIVAGRRRAAAEDAAHC